MSESVSWAPCADRVLAIRVDPGTLQIQVADAGSGSQGPGFSLFVLAHPEGHH